MNTVKKTIIGLSFIAAGAVIVLGNYGIIPEGIRRIIISWQMLVMLIGLMVLTDRNYTGAAVLISVGAFFMLPLIPGLSLGTHFVRNFWPLMLVIVGLIILFSHKGKQSDTPNTSVNISINGSKTGTEYDGRAKTDTYSQDGRIDQSFCFTGSDQVFVGPEFKGGQISAVFGGTSLDLTKTSLPEDGCADLKIKAMFGGVTVIVPADWKVDIKNSSFLGGVSDSRPHDMERNSSGILILRVESLFGGVEIK